MMIRSRVQHGGHEVKLTVIKFRIQKDLKFKLLTNMAFNFPRSAKKCSRKKILKNISFANIYSIVAEK